MPRLSTPSRASVAVPSRQRNVRWIRIRPPRSSSPNCRGGAATRWLAERQGLTDADARLLLRQSPDNYVVERTRLVKQARAAGQRDVANFYQSLKRPTMSQWAVLAAADDADAVNDVVAATKDLAEVQAGGSNAAALATATKKRKAALEALVDRGVAALGQSDAGAESRRGEIRGMIDQLSCHPELAESWIDANVA